MTLKVILTKYRLLCVCMHVLLPRLFVGFGFFYYGSTSKVFEENKFKLAAASDGV